MGLEVLKALERSTHTWEIATTPRDVLHITNNRWGLDAIAAKSMVRLSVRGVSGVFSLPLTGSTADFRRETGENT